LLIREFRQTGKIGLQNFYMRRALRILPVYFAYLFVIFLLQLFTEWHQPLTIWIGNLTFTTNFLPRTWTTGHLWSLAVEEQFYLLWPLLLVLVGLSRNENRAYYILAVPLIVAPISRVISYINVSPAIIHPLFQGYSFLNYFDSLAIGCIAAVALTKHKDGISAVLCQLKLESLLSGIVLIAIPYILSKLFLFGIFTVPFGNTCQAVGFAILLLQSILFPELFKPLNWPVIKIVGVLSYSIYIWQEIFCSNPRYFGFSNYWFMSFPGWLLAACSMATFSYYGIEKPLMGMRARLRPTNQWSCQ